MAVDSLSRFIDSFKGLHKNVSPFKVPLGGAADGENFWVKDGRIESMSGLTTLTAPASAVIQEISWYKPKSGSAYLCCVCGGAFYERSGGSWAAHSLPELDTADAVSATLTTTVFVLDTLTDYDSFLSACPDIGDTIYFEGESAEAVTITHFYRKASAAGLRITVDSSYGGSASGKLIMKPDALAVTGKVAMTQLGNGLVISDGDRPMMVWDGVILTRLGLPPVVNEDELGAACLAWDTDAAGYWKSLADDPYHFRFVWHNENLGEYSSWIGEGGDYSGSTGVYVLNEPGSESSLLVDMTSYPSRKPDAATHLLIFVRKYGGTGELMEHLGTVAVGGSTKYWGPSTKPGGPEDFAPGFDEGLGGYPYRPIGVSMRARLSYRHSTLDEALDEAFRRNPPFPLTTHRGVLMGPIDGEPSVVEGSGWPADPSPTGGLMEPWAWGWHNWQPNPTDGEAVKTITRAGGRTYLSKESSLYQLDDRANDPAVWNWDKLRVGLGFVGSHAASEYGGRLWGIVRTRKGTERIAVYDGKRMRIDPRLGDLTGYDIVHGESGMLFVAGGDPTYILDGETQEWFAHSLASLTAVRSSPGDATYDFVAGVVGGSIYQYFTGYAGVFTWTSGAITFGKPWLFKSFRRICFGLSASGALTDVKIEVKVDARAWVTLATGLSVGTAFLHWKAGLEGMDGKLIQFRISNTSAAQKLNIEYMQLDGAIQEGVRDRR